ncbi:MAG: hypothetical protein WCF68_02590 [Terriglobales bacterium]
MAFFRSNRRLIAIATAAIAVGMAATLVACGDSKYQPPAIAVTFDSSFAPPSSIDTGAYAGIAADVANDSKNAGVKFSCAPAGDCGSFTPASIASSIPTCYLAPESVPEGGTVTITATSNTDPTKFVTSSAITIVSGPAHACP